MNILDHFYYQMKYVSFLAFKESTFPLRLNTSIRFIFRKHRKLFYEKGYREKWELDYKDTLPWLESSMPMFIIYDLENNRPAVLKLFNQLDSKGEYGSESQDVSL